MVGFIANPASGRDIRRIVAKASVFQTSEKCNMLQRVLTALGALGVETVLMMPDMGGIAAALLRAIQAHRADEATMPWPRVEFLDMPISQSADDSYYATRMMVKQGVRAIVVLGGDGTNRVVASACDDVPLVPLSTGTNNAFPELREATIAGLAAGLVATGRVPVGQATRRNKILRVISPTREELALVDVCVTTHFSIGSRALWETETMSELYVTFAESDAIGMSSIAGLLQPISRDDPCGLRLRFCPDNSQARTSLTAPIAPGLVAKLYVAEMEQIEPGILHRISTSAGTIALDGEREIEFGPDDDLTVRLDAKGPFTVDIQRTMRIAAEKGLLRG
jgi:predicted polyphosphate/ATP-dependent NAD kinase